MNLPDETIAKQRLIVLVPESLAGNADLVKKIYWMALRDHSDVFYLALVDEEETQLTVTRGLATMKALTAHPEICVGSKIVTSQRLVSTLCDLHQPGDVIVCHEGQFARDGFLNAIPIQDLLASALQAPTITVSGFYRPWRALTRRWLLGLVFWLGCLAILAGFGVLEFQVNRLMPGLTGTLLVMFLLAGEFAAFWAWNHLPKS